MSDPFRIYRPEELGRDGYPTVWHKNDGTLNELIDAELERGSVIDYKAGIKHIVRAQAGHRCIRCQHPFLVGTSGTFEGSSANAEEMASALGLTQETLDQAMLAADGQFLTNVRDLDRTPRKLWSACDSVCRHGGPMRVWVRDHDKERWEPFDPTPEACGPAVATVGKAEALWRVLTVHHLNECKPDLRWWNLAALCQRCHLLIQGKVDMEKPWPWEHSDWFKPYVAAFYAAKYLGHDVDRATAEGAWQEGLLKMGAEHESVERMPL